MTDALSRRRLLAGTALAAPVVPFADHALHMAAHGAVAIRACVDLPDAFDDMPGDEAEAEVDRLLDVVDRKLDIVISTPAMTLTDLRDKAMAVVDEVQHFRPEILDLAGSGDRTDLLLGSLIRDVLALTAEAAHG